MDFLNFAYYIKLPSKFIRTNNGRKPISEGRSDKSLFPRSRVLRFLNYIISGSISLILLLLSNRTETKSMPLYLLYMNY